MTAAGPKMWNVTPSLVQKTGVRRGYGLLAHRGGDVLVGFTRCQECGYESRPLTAHCELCGEVLYESN